MYRVVGDEMIKRELNERTFIVVFERKDNFEPQSIGKVLEEGKLKGYKKIKFYNHEEAKARGLSVGSDVYTFIFKK